MLQIRDLRFAWPGAADCIAIDALDLAAGRTVFLHGPSGCGKSTLLGLMAGVLQARSGLGVAAGPGLGRPAPGPSRCSAR